MSTPGAPSRRAEYDSALAAASETISSVNAGDPGASLRAVQHITTALGLAKQLNKSTAGDSEAARLARTLLARSAELRWTAVVPLIDALREKRLDDVRELAQIAMARAELERQTFDFDGQAELFGCARRCFSAVSDHAGSHAAQNAAADALVAKAESYLAAATGPSWLVDAALADALKALRLCKGRDEERARVHALRKSLQPALVGQMGRVSVPFSPEPIMSAARVALDQLRRPAAVLWLCTHATRLPSAQQLRDQGQFSFAESLPTSWIDADGRTVAVTSGTDDDALAHRGLAHLSACGLVVAAVLTAFKQRFGDDRADANILPTFGQLVAPGRRQSVGLAVLSGVEGNWEIALPTLFPQVEQMFRVILSRPFTLSDENPDFERFPDLGSMLRHHRGALAAVIGERDALAWYLLCATAGGDRRNRVLHGLDDDAHLGNALDVMAWWLFLRLVFGVARAEPVSI